MTGIASKLKQAGYATHMVSMGKYANVYLSVLYDLKVFEETSAFIFGSPFHSLRDFSFPHYWAPSVKGFFGSDFENKPVNLSLSMEVAPVAVDEKNNERLIARTTTVGEKHAWPNPILDLLV